MSSLLEQIFEREIVEAPSGELIRIHSMISRQEADFLSNLIASDSNIKRTLEVGCAYGLSSLAICSALRERPDAHHTIVDPFQTTDWKSVGINNLRCENLTFFSLIEEGSEFALPDLTRKQKGAFDLIFIDGVHTFDHALLDCFYSTKLLRIGGYLVIDDADMWGIPAVVSYLKNYPCYEWVGGVTDQQFRTRKADFLKAMLSIPPLSIVQRHLSHRVRHAISIKYSLVALRKTREDGRTWNWWEEI